MEEKRKRRLESGKRPLLAPSSFLTEDKYDHDPENMKIKPSILGISLLFSYGNAHLIFVL